MLKQTLERHAKALAERNGTSVEKAIREIRDNPGLIVEKLRLDDYKPLDVELWATDWLARGVKGLT